MVLKRNIPATAVTPAIDELKSKGFVVERLVIRVEDIIAPALSKRSEYRISWSNA